MKTTQDRVNRSIVYLAAPAIVAMLGLGAHAAFAMCATPTGPFTFLSTKVIFKIGTTTLTCSNATTTFVVQPPPNNCESNPGGPLFIPLASPPTFTGCQINSSGFTASATITASGTWQFGLSDVGPTGELIIPQNGLKVTANILGSTCTTIAGSATVVGTWSNTSSAATFTNQSVPVRTSGGFPCPSGTSATFSGTFTASPALSYVNPNP